MRYSLSDYTISSAQKGWGPGWPTDRWADMAHVKAPSGTAVNCHRRIARLVSTLFAVIEGRGYLLRQADTGAYVNRQIAGTNTPSNHSWGLAIDINWQSNPVSHDGKAHTDYPSWFVPLWNTYGFAWGGVYTGSYRDAMHFEFMGGPADADEMTDQAINDLRAQAPEDDMFSDSDRNMLKTIATRSAHVDTMLSSNLAVLLSVPSLVKSAAEADASASKLVLDTVSKMQTASLPADVRAQLAKDIASQVSDLTVGEIAQRLSVDTPVQ